MRVCIFSARERPELPNLCAATVRHHHPTAHIVHMTDTVTLAIDQADEVRRIFWNKEEQSVTWLRLEHFAALDDEPTVLLDSDTLVRGDLDGVFDQPFDVALTVRHKDPRYNAGVMFSRCGAFWRALREHIHEHGDVTDFMAIDRTLEKMDDFNILDLPVGRWNCSDMKEDFIPHCTVLHYKGLRKGMMPKHFYQYVWHREVA